MIHICIGNLTMIGSGNGSDNGLSPGRRQAITWTNVGILLIGPLGTNFSEMLIEIHTFSFKKIHWKMSPGKWRPFSLSLNVLSVVFILQRHWKICHSQCPRNMSVFQTCLTFVWRLPCNFTMEYIASSEKCLTFHYRISHTLHNDGVYHTWDKSWISMNMMCMYSNAGIHGINRKSFPWETEMPGTGLWKQSKE